MERNQEAANPAENESTPKSSWSNDNVNSTENVGNDSQIKAEGDQGSEEANFGNCSTKRERGPDSRKGKLEDQSGENSDDMAGKWGQFGRENEQNLKSQNDNEVQKKVDLKEEPKKEENEEHSSFGDQTESSKFGRDTPNWGPTDGANSGERNPVNAKSSNNNDWGSKTGKSWDKPSNNEKSWGESKPRDSGENSGEYQPRKRILESIEFDNFEERFTRARKSHF